MTFVAMQRRPTKRPIDRRLLELAVARHAEAEDRFTVAVLLDLDCGEIVWLYRHDEPWADVDDDVELVRRLDAFIAAQSRRVEIVPALTVEQHRDVLRAFLAGHWPDRDHERRAAFARFDGEVDAWVADPRNRHVLAAFRAFRDWHVAELAEAWAERHGFTLH